MCVSLVNIVYTVCAAAGFINKISAKNGVLGVTSVDDELFVLLDRDDDQVAVYRR